MMMNENQANSNDRTRYSDEELDEFKAMIDKKIEEARQQLETLREQLTDLNESDETSKAGTFEDGASTWQREHINKLASRQQSFIRDLEYALIRIRNKTYGVCTVTGKLMDKKRLMLVPHATKSVEGKQTEQEIASGQPKPKRPLTTPTTPPTEEKRTAAGKKVFSKPINTTPAPKTKSGNKEKDFEFLDDEDDDLLPNNDTLDFDGLMVDDHND